MWLGVEMRKRINNEDAASEFTKSFIPDLNKET